MHRSELFRLFPPSDPGRLRGAPFRRLLVVGRPSLSLLLLIGLACFPVSRALADQELTVMLTGNLLGRFDLETEGQDEQDPFLLIARGMLAEKMKKSTLYLDLGNAFYPGSLSKFSYGVVVMEFFEAFSCAATLVSSHDLRIGVENLEALQRGKTTKLLSANLLRDGKPMFAAYTIWNAGGTSLAVLGVSSDQVLFDIAERTLFNLDVEYPREGFGVFLHQIRRHGADRILLLSGMSLRKTLALLSEFPEIELAICGGDNRGEVFRCPTARIEMEDGRSIVLLPESDGYTSLDLVLGDSGIRVKELRRRPEAQLRAEAAMRPSSLRVPEYMAFSRRLLIWKEKFRQEGETVVASTGRRAFALDDEKVSFLLRDRFNAEVSLVEEGSIHRSVWGEDVRRSDVIAAVGQDFNLFVYRLTGKQLRKVTQTAKSMLVNGIEDDRVQGYRVEAKRKYRVVSTQAAFDKVERILREPIPYENSWITLTDLLLADLKGKGVIFRDDYDYLDRRFRTTVDFKLSNFFENASVSKAEEDKTPPGWPSDSYSQWGLENEISVVFYNHRHQFVFLPYISYQRTTDIYLKNMLRGTLFYNYNTLAIVKPYFKSQVETVVEEVGGRPVVIRETFGAYLTPERWNAKLGVGMEKKVRDPSEDAFFGAEAQASVRLPLWEKIEYQLDLDTFVSMQSIAESRDYIRAEVVNGISVPLMSNLDIGLKHKWFFFRSPEYLENYSSSQVLTTLDLKMDTKIW